MAGAVSAHSAEAFASFAPPTSLGHFAPARLAQRRHVPALSKCWLPRKMLLMLADLSGRCDYYTEPEARPVAIWAMATGRSGESSGSRASSPHAGGRRHRLYNAVIASRRARAEMIARRQLPPARNAMIMPRAFWRHDSRLLADT